ncbi:MAG: tetratricopeptide repeat protein, partial [Smithella sp.]
ILFMLSLMSKPMLVTLPFALLLLDYWPLNRWQTQGTRPGSSLKPAGKLILEKIPFVLISIASSIITLWAQNKSGALVKTDSIPFDARFSNAIFSYVAYLGKILWPADLAVYYPYEMSLSLWKVMSAGLVIIFISVAVLHYIRKMPFLFAGWFWYLGTLIPVIGLIQVGSQAMADRYTYLPSIGIGIVLAWGTAYLIKSENIRRRVVLPTAIALLAVLIILTFQQCGYWKNSVMLFHHTLKVTKNNDKMHHNLGTHFYKEGKFREAIDHFSKAININSNYLSYNSRGVIYARAGMYQQALSDFNKSISLMPNNINGYYNRGLVYDKIKKYQLAIGDFNKVISLKNDYVDAYNNRGIVYAKLGQYESAIEDFTKTISLQPGHVYAYSNRASAYFAQGNNEPGCGDVKKACAAGKCEPFKKAQAGGLCH